LIICTKLKAHPQKGVKVRFSFLPGVEGGNIYYVCNLLELCNKDILILKL
jgi:hypothetical protein